MESDGLSNFIGGEWVSGRGPEAEVKNPATGRTVASFRISVEEDVNDAIVSAEKAFHAWGDTSVASRSSALFSLRELLQRERESLARTIVLENGKTYAEAIGEFDRALQYVEHACAIAELMKGAISENVGADVDTYYIREPLGVFAVIAPFNFPAMIPLYFSWAVAAGNPVIVKPSELCPLTTVRIMELVESADFPLGVVNMLLGGADTVNKLCAHPSVAGVSFVGSSTAAEAVFRLASQHGKRAQCQGGAKNHLVITDSAHLDRCMDNIVASLFGSASQRCFAGSNVLVYDEIYDLFVDKLLDLVRGIRVGDGLTPGVDMGPVISEQALHRFHRIIDEALQAGAKLLLDGRAVNGDSSEGYFLGPTIFEAEPGMSVFDDEVFGPIRCVKAVGDLDEAVNIVNCSRFGHSAVVYTENGGTARRFSRMVNTGQVGVNIGTPAPIAFYPVGGRKRSFYGSLRGRANDAIDFYTDKKVIVSTWHS
jgi:malonate-semialdehyde dehydrogenase (acetylating)/methylmalonate-semialdehyde dehydrogenase